MLNFNLSEVNEQIRDISRKFAKERIAPSVIERDIHSIYPKEIIAELAELGFMGFLVSPEWGGSGLDAISYVIALEEICKVDASIGIVMSVHNSLVCWIIENYGTDEQKVKYLPKLASGEYIGAYCLSEPNAGSDARGITTSAVKKGDKWILNGTKNWISTAENANLFIVFVQTNPELKHKGIACFIVNKGLPGLEIGKKEDKMGMRSSDTCSVHFTNMELNEEDLLGGLGEGFYIAMRGLNGGRIGIAAQALGIAQGAFEIAVKYSKERIAMGRPICEHQLIQAKLAQMSMKIDASRLLVYKAAFLKDAKLPHIKEASEAKLFASTTAMEVTREAVQILGGYGYVREYLVEKMMRDAKVTEIYEGTSEIQHIVIAREILKTY